MDRPTIICLTPVRNEAWILDTFLQCASIWADHIIIADQHSTDGSREIALRYPKVLLIENKSKSYNESERQSLLISEARRIPGQRLLVALDADELFTSDFMQTQEWEEILTSSPGSVFGFNWINLLDGYKQCWVSEGCFPWVFMDDGSAHIGEQIHSPRVPLSSWEDIIPVHEIKVLHYQYVNWKRMQSKQVYYQCQERLKYPNKSAVEIFRTYHHMYLKAGRNLVPCLEDWFREYENKGIAVRAVDLEENNWFDQEVVNLVMKHGGLKFQKECIWDNELLELDPRNSFDKIVHFWLKSTQFKANSKLVQSTDRLLKHIY